MTHLAKKTLPPPESEQPPQAPKAKGKTKPRGRYRTTIAPIVLLERQRVGGANIPLWLLVLATLQRLALELGDPSAIQLYNEVSDRLAPPPSEDANVYMLAPERLSAEEWEVRARALRKPNKS